MKIATTYPSEKLAYGVVGDAIVIISIIKGATGVIKQSGEWVVVGKDIAIGGVKKVFTKPDTPHHKTYIDTGGHKYKVGDDAALSKLEIIDDISHLPKLRQEYIKEVRGLKKVVDNLYEQGKSAEEVARAVSQMRTDIGIQYKDMTPPKQ